MTILGPGLPGLVVVVVVVQHGVGTDASYNSRCHPQQMSVPFVIFNSIQFLYYSTLHIAFILTYDYIQKSRYSSNCNNQRLVLTVGGIYFIYTI